MPTPQLRAPHLDARIHPVRTRPRPMGRSCSYNLTTHGSRGSTEWTECESTRVWKNRRLDCDRPFSTGGPRLRQLAIGAEVARWNEARHIIRDTDGTIVEINIYGSGRTRSDHRSRRCAQLSSRHDITRLVLACLGGCSEPAQAWSGAVGGCQRSSSRPTVTVRWRGRRSWTTRSVVSSSRRRKSRWRQRASGLARFSCGCGVETK